jgi:2'-5' RNA ligase
MKTDFDLPELDCAVADWPEFDWQGERRLFVGVAPDLAQKALLTPLLNQLPSPLQAVKPDNLHLTLLFLGQSSAAQTKLLWRQLQAQASLPAFEVQLNTLELWPGPAVFCLTGAIQDPRLLLLDSQLQQAAAIAGFPPPQHQLKPHITLARKAKHWPDPAPAAIELTLSADELLLYHSISTPEGVCYKPIASLPFTAA